MKSKIKKYTKVKIVNYSNSILNNTQGIVMSDLYESEIENGKLVYGYDVETSYGDQFIEKEHIQEI